MVLRKWHNRNKMLMSLTFVFLFLIINANEDSHEYGGLFEPPSGKTYHGVGWGEGGQIQYGNIFPDSMQPLLYQGIFSIPGNPQRPLTVDRLLRMLEPDHIDHQKQFAELSVHFSDASQMLDSAFAFTDQYDHYIDTLAQALILHNRPVFLRVGLEVNGPWNGYTPWIFPKAFKKLVEEMRIRSVDCMATVWCYEPDAEADFADSTEMGWKWYPGDDVVDWFGLDLFDVEHFDPEEPDFSRDSLTLKGRSEFFLQFAQEREKPVYLNELSARHVYITPDAEDPDSVDGIHDWEFWFEPFFAFLELHPNVKAFNYINLDWTEIEQYSTWGDARIEINSYIKENWIEKLSDPRFQHIGTDLVNPTNVDEGIRIKRDPESFIRLTAAPNPFNASTSFEYYLAKNSQVVLEVYNLLGQRIRTLFIGKEVRGLHHYLWQPIDLSSGIYFIILKTDFDTQITKVIYMK